MEIETVGLEKMDEEMATVAAFLLSSDASFVTGHALAADGGYTAGRDPGATLLMGL